MDFFAQFLVGRLNGYLRLTNWGQTYLSKLNGQIIEFNIVDISQSYRLSIGEDKIAFTADEELTTLSLIGKSRDFLSVLFYVRRRESIPAGLLEITGDLSAMQDLQKFLSTIGVGFEEFLSSTIGDIGSHQLIRLYESFVRKFENRAQLTIDDVKDFLIFEINLLPNAEEVGRTENEVYQIAETVDRMEVRLKRVIKELGKDG